jgi:hypothetical protein
VAAEIQVFILCGEVVTTDNGFNLMQAAPNELLTNIFPTKTELCFFLQLRKETADAIAELDIEIRIHNQDGHLTYGPFTTHVAFTRGNRFAVVSGLIHPTFPAPDEYTITARATADGHVNECRYDINVQHAGQPANNG